MAPFAMPANPLAWWRHGGFDLDNSEWADATGNGHTANLKPDSTGTGFAALYEAEHGTRGHVTALKGGPSDSIEFGAVLGRSYTVCSTTRYAGGTRRAVLQSAYWFHGHWAAQVGVSFYGQWITGTGTERLPSGESKWAEQDWMVLCGPPNL